MLQEASYYARLALSFGRLRFAPLELDPAGVVRRNLENRQQNFLSLLRKAVFDRPSNPYRTLFAWAGCEYGDLERGVRKDGIEETLESLRQSGVYLLHDEFKGKQPIRRGGQTLAVQSSDFANPLHRGEVPTSSSGSRSRATVTSQSLEYMLYREMQDQNFVDALDAGGRKDVRISALLPSAEGLQRALLSTRRGHAIDQWFAQWGSFQTSGHYQWMTRWFVLQARLLGVNIPFHTRLPHDDFSPVARWIARRKPEGVLCVLTAGVSNAVRVAAAAMENGWDIGGTIVRVYGESLTQAKRAVLEAAGAKPYPLYSISELGKVSGACLEMTSGNGGHVCQDSLALIGYKKRVPPSDLEVDSLLFTSLLPFAPFVLVNVEMEDSGILGPARCGCALSKLGLTQQVSDIFSYGKLTTQGMTLPGAEVLKILEERLPAQFGGVPGDYQLTEREGGRQTEIELRVHPRVGASSEDQVRNFFLAELRRVYGGALSSRHWAQTNGVKVVFAAPYKTGSRDKVHPLHLLRAATQEDSREPAPRADAGHA
jgi:hypothetical protein